MSDHPDHFAVGAEVVVVRRNGRSVLGRYPQRVARHTKTMVVLENGKMFKRTVLRGLEDRVSYEQYPRYLNYGTVIEAAPDPAGTPGTEDDS